MNTVIRNSPVSGEPHPVESSLFVSVIIPVFNDQEGVDSCLGALKQQNYPHNRFEVIVVDNASSSPIRIDPAYANFARIVVCGTPGAYAARNVGITAAIGEVFAFTDADCLPNPNWISAGLAALHASHPPCVIGGEVEMLLSPRPTAVELYQYLTGFMQFENINNRGFIATANLFVFKTHLAEIGLFDESLLSGGDREWSWRAAKAGYRVKFAADAIVVTSPRNSLAAAIRQARRIAGGRYALRRESMNHLPSTGLKPHRTPWRALTWIFFHTELNTWNRLRVFWVAAILYLVQVTETVRLALGHKPERR